MFSGSLDADANPTDRLLLFRAGGTSGPDFAADRSPPQVSFESASAHPAVAARSDLPSERHSRFGGGSNCGLQSPRVASIPRPLGPAEADRERQASERREEKDARRRVLVR